MDKVYEYIGTRIYLPTNTGNMGNNGSWSQGVQKNKKRKVTLQERLAPKKATQPGGWVGGSQLSRGKNKARQRLGRTRLRVSNLVEDGKTSSSSLSV